MTESLVVERDTTLRGTVEAGAHVEGAVLKVLGVFSGPMTLDDSAVLEVLGVLDVRGPADNRGTVIVAGVLNGDIRDLLTPAGRLAVAAGTIVNPFRDEPYRVERDGTRTPTGDHVDDVNPDARNYLAYVPDDDRWQPLGDVTG